ncbi:MAG: transposase [Gammaproteobacteria bacterium]|nr:transposase [Gammaproteobacteria bacterium]
MRYRRSNITGATYFFTVNLAQRGTTLLVDYVDDLREVIKKTKQNHTFYIDAMVIMPDHLHALWTLPVDDADFSTRWSLIKTGFSRRIQKVEPISASRHSKSERGIWQRRFWEHLIKDKRDYQNHVTYIHNNPVKHGFVTHASEWPWSSLHRRLG